VHVWQHRDIAHVLVLYEASVPGAPMRDRGGGQLVTHPPQRALVGRRLHERPRHREQSDSVRVGEPKTLRGNQTRRGRPVRETTLTRVIANTAALSGNVVATLVIARHSAACRTNPVEPTPAPAPARPDERPDKLLTLPSFSRDTRLLYCPYCD